MDHICQRPGGGAVFTPCLLIGAVPCLIFRQMKSRQVWNINVRRCFWISVARRLLNSIRQRPGLHQLFQQGRIF